MRSLLSAPWIDGLAQHAMRGIRCRRRIAEHVRACRQRCGDRGRFHCEEPTADTAIHFGEFDVVLAIGRVRQLDDARAASLFALARGALRSGGRLIRLDGAFVARQSRLVRALLVADRGKFVRTEPDDRAPATREFREVRSFLSEDLFCIPYNTLIMECTR